MIAYHILLYSYLEDKKFLLTDIFTCQRSDMESKNMQRKLKSMSCCWYILEIELGQGSKKKKLEFSNFVGDPPPPLKLENIQFFYITRRANFSN